MNPIIVTPVTPTPVPPIQQQAKRLVQQQQQAFFALGQAYAQTKQFIWGNPANAQSAFSAFTAAGYKATDLLVNSEAYLALYQAVTGITLPSPVPIGYSLTSNSDNSVTVVAPAPQQ